MKALITGGCGFVGSNIVDLLLKEGHYVRVIDDLSTGHYDNISTYVGKEKFEFVKGNICDFNVINNVMRGTDIVFHLAASVGRQRSLDNPQLDSEINLIGTINVLEAMRSNRVKK